MMMLVILPDVLSMFTFQTVNKKHLWTRFENVYYMLGIKCKMNCEKTDRKMIEHHGQISDNPVSEVLKFTLEAPRES